MSTDKKIRIRTALKNRHPEWSQAYILKLIANGRVELNGKTAGPHDWVDLKDYLFIDIVGLRTTLEPNTAVDCHLITLTKDYILLAKGPFVHSVAHDFEETNSVSNWLLTIDPTLFDLDTLECGLGHRLDFETSGVMVAGRSKKTLAHLENEFREHRVVKDYVCLVDQEPPTPGLYTAFACKHPKSTKRILITNADTSEALTPIQTQILSVEKTNDAWRLRIRLMTGYRHQIRAHLAFLGSPIRGDKIYGGKSAERLMLHAQALEFKDAAGVVVRAERPAGF